MVLFGAIGLALAVLTASTPRAVVCVGGSSGMGKAAAISVVARGGRVLLASRSAEKLDAARTEIISCTGSDMVSVQTYVLDASDEAAVAEFAASEILSQFQPDALVVTSAGAAPHGPITTLPTASTQSLFGSKFWSAYHACKHIAPILADGGAIALVAGVLNRRPGVNCVPLATVNGALEGLTRALALEFGPRLRVNCLSPGFCDTERFDRMDPAKKVAMLANTADSLPLRRVGKPSDMGEAIDFLLTSRFSTGVVLDVDGGHHIRQYASAATDPMRAPGGG
jgi:NAD(P)-dependent dehydrogenase (short-subunit alcohol dehydrogenase family)